MTALRYERDMPAVIDAVVIVGSSCTGKTTLVQAVRDAIVRGELEGVAVPRRFITRARRPDDIEGESDFVTKAELDAWTAAGQTSMHWSRTLEAGHTEHYAFARPPDGMLAVYSANNAILEPGNVQPSDALARALLVGIYAPDDIRVQRLRARSPVLWRDAPAEAAARLADHAGNVLAHVHVVVENHGQHEQDAAAELVALVRSNAPKR